MEINFGKNSCRLTLQNKIQNAEIRDNIDGGTTVMNIINGKRLGWYGHLKHLHYSQWPELMLKRLLWQRRKRRAKITKV